MAETEQADCGWSGDRFADGGFLTVYAFDDQARGVLATWPAGIGSRAQTVANLLVVVVHEVVEARVA
jgi:hypothetical protein